MTTSKLWERALTTVGTIAQYNSKRDSVAMALRDTIRKRNRQIAQLRKECFRLKQMNMSLLRDTYRVSPESFTADGHFVTTETIATE